MDEVNKAISSYLQSGQYYIDARNWYLRKCVYPIIQRSIICVMAIITLISAIIVSWACYALLPVKREVPLALKLSNTIKYYPSIQRIDQADESTQNAVAKFLVGTYVVDRESYRYNNIETQINKIKNTSSKFEFKQFYSYISLENPDSPILIYQRYLTRDISILSMSFNGSDNNLIVKFIASVKDEKTKEQNVTTWLANVTFDMDDISNLSKDNNQLNFIVTDYKVQQVK